LPPFLLRFYTSLVSQNCFKQKTEMTAKQGLFDLFKNHLLALCIEAPQFNLWQINTPVAANSSRAQEKQQTRWFLTPTRFFLSCSKFHLLWFQQHKCMDREERRRRTTIKTNRKDENFQTQVEEFPLGPRSHRSLFI
jgi:hypothetical protein